MFDIPSAHQLMQRDSLLDRPVANLVLPVVLCVGLLALIILPKAPVVGEGSQSAEQPTIGPLFP